MKRHSEILITFSSLVFLLVFAVWFAASNVREAVESVTVVYWTHEDDARTALEERLIGQFEKLHPNVHIERVVKSTSEMLDLTPRAFAAGKGPDMFNLPLEAIGPLLAKGYVAPLNPDAVGYPSLEELRSTYVDGVFDPVTIDSAIYGMPLEYTNWCLYLNKQRFKEVGLDAEKEYPRTWEDVVRLSEMMVVRDGSVLKRRGFDFRYPFYLNFLVPMVEQLGGSLLSRDGKEAIVGEDAWVRLLSFMRQWGPHGLNLGSPTYRNARFCFAGDDATASMALSGIYQEQRMAKAESAFFLKGEWMVVPFPQFEHAVSHVSACTYAHYLMVGAGAPEDTREAAWTFIGFLLRHSEEYLAETGLLMPTKLMLDSPSLEVVPYHQVFIDDMQTSKPAYSGPVSSAMQDLIARAVERVMLEGVEPAKAYQTLKSAAQELLDEGAR